MGNLSYSNLSAHSELARQGFALLRAALWECPADPSLFKGEANWHALFALAEKQTVVPLMYDAVLTLPTALQPPTGILRQAHLQTIRTAQSHLFLNSRLAEITSRLRAEGLHPVLLKGQGVAHNYPNPLRRACGDIDLYIGEADYERCCRLVNQWGMLDDHAMESIQHLHFNWKGAHIELHRIASTAYHVSRTRTFYQWSDALLQGSDLRTLNLNGVDVNDTPINPAEILLPPIRFDALFIFFHTYKHFLCGGIGLRQLCDWVMYLHVHSGEIDRAVLREDLNRFGLLRPWQMMGQIAVEHLGLPAEEFPFYDGQDNKYAGTADKILELILQGGNFGFYHHHRSTRPAGYLAGKLHSFRAIHRYLFQVYPLCPTHVRNYYRYYIKACITNLFKDRRVAKQITGITATQQ